MRAPFTEPKRLWKVIPIRHQDPVEFARMMQETLNELVSDGWAINGMMERGDALLITAVKVELPSQPSAAETLAPPENVAAKQSVAYSFLQKGTLITEHFDTMPQALGLVGKHLKDPAILPVSLTQHTMVSYEVADIPDLLRAQQDDSP